MKKIPSTVFALQILFAIQNTVFGIWFFIATLGVMTPLLVFPIVFLLAVPILEKKYWPTSLMGMLGVLLPPYAFIIYHLVLRDTSLAILAQELGLILVATIFMSFLLAALHGIIVGIQRRKWKLFWFSGIQIPFFIAPALFVVGMWFNERSVYEPLIPYLVEFTFIIGANTFIAYRQFVKQSIIAQVNKRR